MAWRSIIWISFVVLVWTNFGTPAFGEDNAFTVLFGSEATLQNLQHEVENIKQGLAQSRQRLNSIIETQRNLLAKVVNMEIEIRKHNEYVSTSIKKLLYSEQIRSDGIQRQAHNKQEQEIAANSQRRWLQEEINKFGTKFLATMQKELDSQRQSLEQKLQEKLEVQTEKTKEMFIHTANNLTDIVNNLIKSQNSEILIEPRKSAPNTQPTPKDINLNDKPQDTWPSYKTFLQETNVRFRRNASTGLCDDEFSTVINAWKIFENNLSRSIYCLKDPAGGKSWRVIQRRHIGGNESFDRSWLAYKDGFGDLDYDFFIGLQDIHSMMLPNKSTELWIQLGTKDGHSPYEMYKNFFVTSEENEFRLMFVYGANGTAGDEFTPVIDEPFQAKGMGNVDQKSCTQRMQSGWWYPTDGDLCGSGNLNRDFKDMIWGDWKNIVYTHMAIRYSDNLVNVKHKVLDVDENEQKLRIQKIIESEFSGGEPL
ncbi:PREDICTED: angiopoietin-2-like [Rhagoletis zephyria]|uniref:angiopoietin-2-like n=1 Tax=Rhagoletis zephyria TaxID=28612 RepID=UPI0008116170|nr:PREDICTED: angiopoietin-2-like [Rhagoletis zephyria]XP_017488503.1 PREDICTED: angiopoietin-2-like [Rhagoletis zephyria]